MKYIAPAKELSDRGRKSCGLLCMVKNTSGSYFCVVECHCDKMLVFRTDRVLLGTSKDVLVFFVYVPPSNSPYYDSIDEIDGIHIH